MKSLKLPVLGAAIAVLIFLVWPRQITFIDTMDSPEGPWTLIRDITYFGWNSNLSDHTRFARLQKFKTYLSIESPQGRVGHFLEGEVSVVAAAQAPHGILLAIDGWEGPTRANGCLLYKVLRRLPNGEVELLTPAARDASNSWHLIEEPRTSFGAFPAGLTVNQNPRLKKDFQILAPVPACD